MNYLIILAILLALFALKLTKMAVILVLAAVIIFSIARSSVFRDFFGKKDKR
jgi:hypothetical protein